MRAVSDGYSAEGPIANQQNLNNAFSLFFVILSPDYVSHLNLLSRADTTMDNACVMMSAQICFFSD